MITIEAYRSAVGRFSGKAKIISNARANKNMNYTNDVLLILILSFIQLALYGLVLAVMHAGFYFILALLMITLA